MAAEDEDDDDAPRFIPDDDFFGWMVWDSACAPAPLKEPNNQNHTYIHIMWKQKKKSGGMCQNLKMGSGERETWILMFSQTGDALSSM